MWFTSSLYVEIDKPDGMLHRGNRHTKFPLPLFFREYMQGKDVSSDSP